MEAFIDIIMPWVAVAGFTLAGLVTLAILRGTCED